MFEFGLLLVLSSWDYDCSQEGSFECTKGVCDQTRRHGDSMFVDCLSCLFFDATVTPRLNSLSRTRSRSWAGQRQFEFASRPLSDADMALASWLLFDATDRQTDRQTDRELVAHIHDHMWLVLGFSSLHQCVFT